MKNNILIDKPKLIIQILYFCFSIIQALCLCFNSDDFWWANIDKLSDVFFEYSPNGRYFTNAITYLMCNYSLIRFSVHLIFSFGLFLIMGKILEKENVKSWISYFLSAFFILSMPSYLIIHTYNWISGFTNYIVSIFLTFFYIFYCLDSIKGCTKDKVYKSVISLFLGFFGSMCVENITIFNLILSLFIISYSFFKYRKVYIFNFLYLIGSLGGTVFMFSDRNYREIYSSSDNIGIRSFEFSSSDWFYRIFNDIIYYYAKQFFLLHILITISIVVLYLNKGKIRLNFYSRISIGIIVSFCIYSIFMQNEDFVTLDLSLRIRAIETAFTFLYIISLIYSSYFLFNRSKFIRNCIWIVGTVILTAPFIVVSPISPRCFFADYIFWSMIAGEFVVSLSSNNNLFERSVTKISGYSVIAMFVMILSGMNITNKICDEFRIGYVKEQIFNGANTIEMIMLPYDHMCFDSFNILSENSNYGFMFKDGKKYTYSDLMIMYYQFDESIYDKQLVFKQLVDYNVSK